MSLEVTPRLIATPFFFRKKMNRQKKKSLFCIALLFLFLLTHTPTRLDKPPEKTVTVNTQKWKPTAGAKESAQTPAYEQTTRWKVTELYRTIIDNNLFRPLGWTPPRPREPYRLLGTILPTDTNRSPQAIIQTIGKQTYLLTLGEKLDKDTTITAIESKQVILETAGQQRTLNLNTDTWLK